MKEKRNYERFYFSTQIKVYWDIYSEKEGTTVDICDGGALVLVHFDKTPPIGTNMLLQMTKNNNIKEHPILKAKVVRVNGNYIAFSINE